MHSHGQSRHGRLMALTGAVEEPYEGGTSRASDMKEKEGHTGHEEIKYAERHRGPTSKMIQPWRICGEYAPEAREAGLSRVTAAATRCRGFMCILMLMPVNSRASDMKEKEGHTGHEEIKYAERHRGPTSKMIHPWRICGEYAPEAREAGLSRVTAAATRCRGNGLRRK
eukprot:Gb_16872 [translate_table: standard]